MCLKNIPVKLSIMCPRGRSMGDPRDRSGRRIPARPSVHRMAASPPNRVNLLSSSLSCMSRETTLMFLDDGWAVVSQAGHATPETIAV
jgi:hypothetical protein